MAAFKMLTNPMEITVSEASTVAVGQGIVELTVRVISGTVQINTKGPVPETESTSPDYAEGDIIIVLCSLGKLWFDGSGVIAVEI